MDINDLTLVEKIGQKLMVGINTNYITEREKKLITKYKIGGFLLYRKNFVSYDNMLKLITELKTLNKENRIPLFIAIDQEGGRVNRMPKDFKNLPSANKLASKNDLSIITAATHITSQILKNSGFNLNFAPVLDIKRFKDTHAVGDRCFGSTEEDVVKYAIPVMKEYQNNGILPVIKHFPGHGATNIDSHFLLPIINSNLLELEKRDIFPFTKAIEHRCRCNAFRSFVIKK